MFKYEILKLLKRKIILACLILLFVLNGYFFFRLNSFNYKFDKQQFTESNDEYIASFHDKWDNMEKRADAMLDASIFSRNKYTVKTIQKSLRDFKNVNDIKLTNNVTASTPKEAEYQIINILILAGTIIIVFGVISAEDVREEKNLILSTVYGERNYTTTKLCTAILFTSVFVILMSVEVMVMAGVHYGFTNLNASVQSLNYFESCTYHVTIWQYYLLHILIRTAGAVGVLLMSFLMFSLFNKTLFSGVIIAAFGVAEYFLYSLVRGDSKISFIKYINVFSLLDSGKLFSEYINLNLFGNPVRVLTVLCFVYVIFAVLLVAFIYINMRLRRTVRIKNLTGKIVLNLRNFFSDRINGKPLWVHEIVRLTFTYGCIIFIGLSAYICADTVKSYDHKTYGYTEGGYMSAMRFIEGIWDDNKEEEYKEILTLSTSVESRYYNAINEIDYDVNRCKELKDNVENMGIINWFFTKDFFNSSQNDAKLMIIFLALIIPLMTLIFTVDYKNNARKFIKIMPLGGDRLFFTKLIYGVVLCILIQGLVYGSYFYNIFRTYPDVHTEVALQSVDIFQNMSVNMSVKEYITFTFIVTFLGNTAAAVCIMMLANIIKQFIPCVLMSAVLFIGPIMITNINMTGMFFGFNSIAFVRCNSMWKTNLSGEIVSLGILLFITIGLVVIGRLNYEKHIRN